MPSHEVHGLPRTQRLSFSGSLAELTRDDLTDNGVVLSIGGAEQSHVEVGEPDYLLHDYLIRMAAVLQTCARERLSNRTPEILHLGAGALTLPRWVQHFWPSAEQTVVDIEPELVDFVLEHLPMHTPPRNVVADAAEVIGAGGALEVASFDVVVVDLFNSADAPGHLISPEFHAAAFSKVSPGGLLLVNLGDEPPMDFVRAQVRSLLAADPGTGSDAGLLSAPNEVLEGRQEGNLTFAARKSEPLLETELNAIWASGPHPGDVLSGQELLDWAQPARPEYSHKTSH